jgi:signal transduction histidine kinase
MATFEHDMKNLLGVIIGFSNVLLEDLTPGDPKRGDVEEIRKAGERALALLNEWSTAAPGEELT